MNEPKTVFRILANNDKVSTAMKKLNCDLITLYGIIESLQLEGYDISIQEKNKELYIYKKITYRKQKEIKDDLEDLENIKFGVIGDTHIGHKGQQLQLLNDFMVQAYDQGYREFYHCGDLTDGYYVPRRAEHQYECFIRGYDEVKQYVVEMFPQLKGVKYHMISGNHDFTFYKEIGANIVEGICKERKDMEYLGMDQATVKLGKNNKVSIKLMHPDRGCTDVTSTRIQKSIEKLDTSDNPKAVFQGHFHRYYKMIDRNMLGFMVPCFLAGSIFIDRAELPNQIGGILINMYVNKNGEVEYYEYEPILYDKSLTDRNNYKKVKKLVIK